MTADVGFERREWLDRPAIQDLINRYSDAKGDVVSTPARPMANAYKPSGPGWTQSHHP
jgi:hypothetical protein